MERTDKTLYLDDLAVGQRFETRSYAVSAAQIKDFAAQFDPQPFHLDEAAARATIFGGLAASGWHTAAITMRLQVESGLPLANGWLGAAYVEGGSAAQAIDLLEDAIGRLQLLSGAGGYRSRQVDGLFRAILSEAYLAGGDVERARKVADEALAIADAGGWSVAIGYAARAMGRVALATGRFDDAEAALERAQRTFAAGEARAQAARSQWSLAELHAARGDRERAALELSAAQELFVQMRAPRLVERTRRLAAELGVGLAVELPAPTLEGLP